MELIFVYNANSGIFNALSDLAHKTFSPNTYECNLCKITYGISMDKKWREYIDSLTFDTTFLHKDEFVSEYPDYSAEKLPALFSKEGDKLSTLITAKEINALRSVQDFIHTMNKKLSLHENEVWDSC